MDDSPLRTERLRAFLAVAREGGFSRAARALGQSQSAVSQAVIALERGLGEPLFVRDGRVVALTDAGQILRAHAERALGELAAARAAIGKRQRLTAGRLVLGTTDTLACYLLPPVLAAFRARHPELDLGLRLRPSPIVAALAAARRVDVALVTLPLPARLGRARRKTAAAVHAEPLLEQRDVAVCAPGHALAARARVRLAELAPHPLVLLDRTTATRAALDARFAALGTTPRVVMEMTSVEALKRMVELGFGVSVVPELAVADEARRGALVRIALDDGPRREVALVTPTVGPLSHAARAFVEVCRERLR